MPRLRTTPAVPLGRRSRLGGASSAVCSACTHRRGSCSARRLCAMCGTVSAAWRHLSSCRPVRPPWRRAARRARRPVLGNVQRRARARGVGGGRRVTRGGGSQRDTWPQWGWPSLRRMGSHRRRHECEMSSRDSRCVQRRARRSRALLARADGTKWQRGRLTRRSYRSPHSRRTIQRAVWSQKTGLCITTCWLGAEVRATVHGRARRRKRTSRTGSFGRSP